MKLFLFFFLLNATESYAKDYYKKSAIDKAHSHFSKKILAFSNSIDDFFADTKHKKNENRSQLKLTLDNFFRESRGPYTVPDINYQLILPKTQRKLQLFIENDNENKSDETDQAKQNLANQNNLNNQNNVNAGLRYLINKSGIEFSTDTGIIVNIPLKVFARFSARKNIHFRNWVLRVSEQVRWINDNGFSSDLDLDFDRKLSRKVLLRMVNNIFWSDQDYTIRFENGPTLFQKINDKSALSYHAHIVTLNTPGFIVDNYILLTTYRQRLYNRWLFLELSLFTNFPRSNNFHRTPGFVVGFEAVFGHL